METRVSGSLTHFWAYIIFQLLYLASTLASTFPLSSTSSADYFLYVYNVAKHSDQPASTLRIDRLKTAIARVSNQ
jgi:hypothetical protein